MNTFRSIARVLVVTAVLGVSSASAMEETITKFFQQYCADATINKMAFSVPVVGALAAHGFGGNVGKFFRDTFVATQGYNTKGATRHIETIKFGVANGAVRLMADLGSEKVMEEIKKSETVQAVLSYVNKAVDFVPNFPGKAQLTTAAQYVGKEAAVAGTAYGLLLLATK